MLIREREREREREKGSLTNKKMPYPTFINKID